jgi:hypothetical protein
MGTAGEGMSRSAHAALDGHLEKMEDIPPIAFENAKFDPPDDGSIYVRADFMPGGREFASLGKNGSSRETGIYQVGISAPLGLGSGEAEKLADRIIKHFERKTLGGAVRTKLPYRSHAAPDGARLWLTVAVPFFVETFFEKEQ